MVSWEMECTGGGAAGSTFAAALQFFAASQCLLHEDWPPQAKTYNRSSFDFIVVGGGAAGSLIAARLSEIPRATVLLLEAGGDPPFESIIPGYKHSMKNSKYDWKFQSVNDSVSSQALQGGSQYIPCGKMLGGSGSLNDMVYARGFPADYDEWATVLGEEWSWDNVLEYFKKTELLTDERIINDPELSRLHGHDGEIEVSGTNESIYSSNKFLEAFKELGFDIVKDMTNPNAIGVGRISHMIRNGTRDSTLTTLLNKAAKRKNLFVLKNSQVTKIIINKKVARGVKVIQNGVENHYFAKKEVIVTAGTYNTPKLLLLSGLGPKHHLSSLGIDVVADLPVGDNLQDHVKVITFLAADNGTCYSSKASTYMDTVRYLYNRRGYLSQSTDVGVYISVDPDEKNIPGFAIFPSCYTLNSYYNTCMTNSGFNEDICDALKEENKYKEIISFSIEIMKPKSRGKVRLASTDPKDDPLIYSGSFSDLDDLDGFPEVMDIAWSIADTTYFRTKNAYVIDLPVEGCEDLEDEELQKCLAINMGVSARHAVGSVGMGTVLDSKLRVKGIKGLRVADASSMYKIIRGNTYAPVVMIAEMAADFIKQYWFE